MQVQLRYFAMIRELLGRTSEQRLVDHGATAGALFDLVAADAPRLAALKPSTMLMVNEEYVSGDHLLADGDEVAFIPPVSGGSSTPGRLVRVQAAPIDARELEASVATPAAGAVVTFTGTVRDHARGRGVIALEYEAYEPAAETMLAQIAGEISERWGIDQIAVVHRTGRLLPGEASVVIAVASAHRGEAFAACQYLIDRLKEIVPIWKKEFYADGSVWVGSEADYQQETGRLAAATS